jgi:hypothetical protein
MTRPQHNPDRPNEHRTRITLAAITGLLAGTARAVFSWLLDRLTTNC